MNILIFRSICGLVLFNFLGCSCSSSKSGTTDKVTSANSRVESQSESTEVDLIDATTSVANVTPPITPIALDLAVNELRAKIAELKIATTDAEKIATANKIAEITEAAAINTVKTGLSAYESETVKVVTSLKAITTESEAVQKAYDKAVRALSKSVVTLNTYQ